MGRGRGQCAAVTGLHGGGGAGQEEIDSACQVLWDRMKSLGPSVPELIILPVYSSLPSEMQTRIFDPAPTGQRKVPPARCNATLSLPWHAGPILDGVSFGHLSGIQGSFAVLLSLILDIHCTTTSIALLPSESS